VAGDGQITLGDMVMKHHAKKVRRLYHGKIIVGFAGSAADALTLFERLEPSWRSTRATSPARWWNWPRTGAPTASSGAWRPCSWRWTPPGRCSSPAPEMSSNRRRVMAIGSGGPYALAAARALMAHTDLSAKQICQEAMTIAASLCVLYQQRDCY